MFKPFNRWAPINPPPSSSPGPVILSLSKDAGEERGGGLIDLNGLNELNMLIG